MTIQARLGGQEMGRVVYSQEAIAERVEELGREITAAYSEDDDLLLLGLLKGSFIFMADLVRAVDLPLQVDFLMASSYGNATRSSGDVRLMHDPKASLDGRAVIIVEDIVDSGNTINHLIPLLAERGARSMEICALLQKRLGTLIKEPRWVGFEAPREFLVGYGLDFGENFRHLPYIASL